jgi:hypothetical protein
MKYPHLPSLLYPDSSEELRVNNESLDIAKVDLRLRRWDGALLGNTLNGKPLIDFGGQPVFAEICVYELMRLSGWQARWVCTYGASAKAPRMLAGWADVKLTAQQQQPIAEPWVASLLQRIADTNGGSYAGCWDVVGWHQDQLIFTELKRRKQDSIRTTHLDWLGAALQHGLQPHNFLLVEWEFAD